MKKIDLDIHKRQLKEKHILQLFSQILEINLCLWARISSSGRGIHVKFGEGQHLVEKWDDFFRQIKDRKREQYGLQNSYLFDEKHGKKADKYIRITNYIEATNFIEQLKVRNTLQKTYRQCG